MTKTNRRKAAMKTRAKRRMVRTGLVAAAGAFFAYLFDPDRGRRRRTEVKDRLAGTVRRQQRSAERRLSYMEGKATGWAAKSEGAGHVDPADDRVIIHEIKAELSRMDFPTTDVNVDVVDGTAVLRGQLKRPEQVREVRDRVAHVPGVVRVESYLHLPGTPAPNKADALNAPGSSGRATVHHGA